MGCAWLTRSIMRNSNKRAKRAFKKCGPTKNYCINGLFCYYSLAILTAAAKVDGDVRHTRGLEIRSDEVMLHIRPYQAPAWDVPGVYKAVHDSWV